MITLKELKPRTYRWLVFLLAVASVAVSPPKYGGVLKYAVFQRSLSLDPVRVFTTTERWIAGNIFDGLVRYGQGQKLLPAVASSWEASDDRKTWTFHIAESAKFHNGRKISANDVRYSWQRSLRNADPDALSQCGLLLISGAEKYRARARNMVEGIQVLDDSTLRISLEQPGDSFLAMLISPLTWIVPRESVGKSDFNTRPIGCGPFKISSSSGKGDEVLQLEANKEYAWGRPYLDRINFVFVPDFNTALLQFGIGDVDCLEIPNIEFGKFRGESGWSSQLMTFPNSRYVCLRINKEAFQGAEKIPNILKCGIDTRSIMEMLYNQGDPGSGDYQSERAGKLAAEFRNSSWGRLIVPDFSSDAIQVAKRIESDLAKIGVRIEILTLSRSEFQKAISDKSFTLSLEFFPSAVSIPDTGSYLPLFRQHVSILHKPDIYGLADITPQDVFQLDDVYFFK